ncbi:AraC family transcriptional regulator, partial [Phocaeicola dorei]|nr:AraC family transcriptional regulator [Phocaeicola dorei]
MQSYRVPIILLFHYSGKNFHYSWFFVIFAGNEREMTHTDFDGIIFADTLQEFNA